MKKSGSALILMLVGVVVLIGIFILYLIYSSKGLSFNKKSVTDNVQTLPPEKALTDYIKSRVKENYWPDDFTVLPPDYNSKDSQLSGLGLAERYVNNYKLDWRRDNTYFVAFVGYDKKAPNKLFGYTLTIYVKGVGVENDAVVDLYLKNLPQKVRAYSLPKQHDKFTTKISTLLWEEQQTKKYLYEVNYTYNSPDNSSYFPNETVTKITNIRLLDYTSDNPDSKRLEEFQNSDKSIFGGNEIVSE